MVDVRAGDVAWAAEYVDLDSSFISDEEMEALYAEHPGLPRSALDGCPTCDGAGSYRWRQRDRECDCHHQLQLCKHYLRAGIEDLYQRLSWDDYEGDQHGKNEALAYISGHRRMIAAGIGTYWYGTFGAGKTMLACLVAKELIKLGYDVFFCTFQGMCQMFTKGWNSNADRARFERRVVFSRVLILDDVGKEFRTSNNLPESLFDHILRQRAVGARPTIITTNDNSESLGQGYGRAVLSLLQERSLIREFEGADYRPRARNRAIAEVLAGERRPIV